MKYFLFAILLVSGLQGLAQLKGFSIGPFAEYAQPTGRFMETNKNGIGIGLGADIRLAKWGVTGSVGFMHFAGKTINKEADNIKMAAVDAFPVRVGVKYKIAKAVYAKFESGVARFTGSDESALIIAPGIAVRILGVEVLAKYERWQKQQSYGFWGLKAGYNF